MARLAAIAVGCALALLPAPAAADVPIPGPIAGGDSSGNIQLNSADRWIMNRWTARRSGLVRKLYLRTRVEGSSCWRGPARPGYASGSGGVWKVTTHPVLASGRPQIKKVLASALLRPCRRALDDSLAVPLNIRVFRGQ